VVAYPSRHAQVDGLNFRTALKVAYAGFLRLGEIMPGACDRDYFRGEGRVRLGRWEGGWRIRLGKYSRQEDLPLLVEINPNNVTDD
jgi:hypothetical protein